MEISFDPAKREATLRERGLDFADAGLLFDDPSYTTTDDRFDYPEPRFLTFGMIGERIAMIAWTPTLDGVRVISMRKCNEREQARFTARME
ncbi:BrnT family toxin [Sphingomonas solaris]|uniref:BrnT family toxin n=1 Tax=Alterirhizorhabdus solaris TaxID=2529389 RepID=A0A558QT62_9SPHN|nr:BrnT family toxin [Sphingomonas solaris]TVV70330.1 BrnT family toxin [Sphingomonas solaris]